MGEPKGKKSSGWDWENTWFNPNQSEYLRRKKEAEAAAQKASALSTRNMLTYNRVYGPGAYEEMQRQRGLPGKGTSVSAAPAKTQDEGMTFDEALAQFAGGGGGGGNAAAYVASLVNQINDAYNRRQETLGANRTSSLAQINQLAEQYKRNVGNINQSYLQGVAAQNQEIARRAAEQQAMAQRTAQQLSASLTGEGISAQPIQGQAQNIANTLATTNQFQRDLQDRMAQLAASSQAGALSSGELVRQGAAGTLEGNYNSLLNALQAAREQEIMQAQSAGMGGGGGGGRGSSSDPLDQMSKYLKARQLYDEVMSGGGGLDIQSLITSAAKKQPYDFLAGIASNPEIAKLFQ
jgi:hypothetical protein